MKKITALLSLLFLFTAFNCENEPLEGDFVIEDGTDTVISCLEATENTVTATTNFTGVTIDDTNYTQLCLAYQNALTDQIDACGDDGTLQAIIDGLGNCGDENQPNDCKTATTASNDAEMAYNNDNTNTDFCNAYKSVLQNQITACGDTDGSIQAIIDGLNCTPTEASLIGTWRITSLESNGMEELQEELDASGICYWNEVYTETALTDIEYSGTNCDMENVIETIDYLLTSNIISFTNGDDPVEILELTSTTLKYQDTYTEVGVDYIDIYTYSRQ